MNYYKLNNISDFYRYLNYRLMIDTLKYNIKNLKTSLK